VPESLLIALHKVWGGEPRDLEELWLECLDTGRAALGCRSAYLTELFENEVMVRSALDAGPACDLGSCLVLDDLPDAEAVRIRSTVVADAPDQIEPLRQRAVAHSQRWSTHVAAPVMVTGRLYGTLAFADTAARDEPFAAEALAFVELLAARIGAAIETDAALRDNLTGLPNERLLHDRLTQAIARRGRQPGVLAVLYLDLDHFKHINDTMGGHDAGDAVLIAAADRMCRAVRPGDTVARVHGDEFIVLCEAVPDATTAETLAERVREAIRQPLEILVEPIVVTASVGVALVGSEPTTADDVIDRADVAMYRAKTGGRDRVEMVIVP
jgi:diguanylate cyclase (GGDEF)-like protein